MMMLAPPAHCVLALKPHYQKASVALHSKQVQFIQTSIKTFWYAAMYLSISPITH